MPAINLTNNTNLNFNALSADHNATLNRYLTSAITLLMPASFGAPANQLVKDQSELGFPITLSAGGEGKFALKKTTLDVQLGASASIGLIKAGEADFLSDLKLPASPSSSGLVSLALQAKLSVEDDATVSDFTFGIADSATVTLTSYYVAAPGDELLDAVGKAAATLTIPHDLDDLRSIPSGAICRIEATSSLKFSASATYSFLNDPLAVVAIDKLPSFGINATASATLEGTVTHTSGHILTIARLANGLLHLAVSVKNTDDFETSLTVSSGIAAKIGNQDVLAFLLDRINPNSAAEADAIAAQLPDAGKFKSDIKSAIDKTLSTSLAASLKVALERANVRNRAFLYEIDLDVVSKDPDSAAALQSALTGDFTAVTHDGPPLNGIKQLDSALTVTKDDTHTFTMHFLGIFNASSISEFIAKSKVDFTSDTHELVLSDKTLQVVDNNLAAVKLRELVLKDITLTIPASANTPEVNTPLTLSYLDRQGSTSPAEMRQFANVLKFIGASDAAAAQALLNQKLKSYGTCSLFLGLKLNPAQCRQLFLANGQPYAWTHYLTAICEAEQAIYSGLDDLEHSYHLQLFRADQDTWNALQDAGAGAAMVPILKNLGMPDAIAQLAVTDALTAIWWSEAMAAYATALAHGDSLAAAGKDVVVDANRGYNEPWMILATWLLASNPPITGKFVTTGPAAK